jgi:hypothetical protein
MERQRGLHHNLCAGKPAKAGAKLAAQQGSEVIPARIRRRIIGGGGGGGFGSRGARIR